MKIAVSASGKDLNAPVDPRFGRCEYLLIVDTENMSVDAYPNESMNLSGGAGVQSAGFVVSKGARAVLTGKCRPCSRAKGWVADAEWEEDNNREPHHGCRKMN